jgi:hypothetical protein
MTEDGFQLGIAEEHAVCLASMASRMHFHATGSTSISDASPALAPDTGGSRVQRSGSLQGTGLTSAASGKRAAGVGS